MSKIRAVVAGMGHGVPEKVLSNFDLEKLVETSDEWIMQRTGIRERRMCSPEEAASDLSIAAAREALDAAGMTADELDLILVATVSGDFTFPSTACLVQDAIGAKNVPAMDLGAACAGFIYALSTAAAYIESGKKKNVLVIGVDVLTKFVDFTDRSTCILFGDAAGAVILSAQTDTEEGVLHTVMMSDGGGARHIICEVGGSKYPPGTAVAQGLGVHIYMNGAETYRFAVNALGDACLRVLEEVGLTPADVDLFVPHQANIRIIQSAADRLGLPDEKVFKNIEWYGNTSAGSIPLGLYEAQKTGRLKKGDLVLTVGFGAGLVWGANLIRF